MADTAEARRWTLEEHRRLLNIISQQPCLWNTSLEIYRDTILRKRAYETIISEVAAMGFMMDQTAVANKIKNLRETYKRELKKIVDSEDTGSSADSVYVPTLAWFHDAEFWRPHVLTRKTRDTMGRTDKRSGSSSDASSKRSSGSDTSAKAQIIFVKPDKQIASSSRQIESNSSLSVSTAEDSVCDDESGVVMRPRKRRSFEQQCKDNKLVYLSEAVQKLAEVRANSKPPDAVEYFGSYIAERMRMLKAESRIKFEREVTNLLSEFLIQDREEDIYVVEEVTGI